MHRPLTGAKQTTRPTVPASLVGVLCTAGAAGCAPTLDVLGIYFPAWLVSGAVGLIAAYGFVLQLGRLAATRELAQSGVLFCSLTVSVGLLVWWVFFSGF